MPGQRLRFAVFQRDGFQCTYCGGVPPEVRLQVDHVTPRAEGGTDDMDNLVTACFDCNIGKGTEPVERVDLVECIEVRRVECLADLWRYFCDEPIPWPLQRGDPFWDMFIDPVSDGLGIGWMTEQIIAIASEPVTRRRDAFRGRLAAHMAQYDHPHSGARRTRVFHWPETQALVATGRTVN